MVAKKVEAALDPADEGLVRVLLQTVVYGTFAPYQLLEGHGSSRVFFGHLRSDWARMSDSEGTFSVC